MDKLKSMRVFVSVVETGSFRSSANLFGISATMVAKHIQFLETRLNTRLLNRTTRKQSLTESGIVYYQECKRINEDISEAENRIQTLENTPQGTIHINSPITFGNQILAEAIADFIQNYPSINVELTLNNDLVDLYQDKIDITIRIGALNNSALVARQLGTYQLVFCATPTYLANHSTPTKLQDLQQHSCLGFVYSDTQAQYGLKLNTDAFNKMNTRLASNNGQALKTIALKNTGIIMQPKMLVKEEIQSGQLIEILSHETPIPKPVNLIYRNKQLSLKNRVFVEFIIDKLRGSF